MSENQDLINALKSEIIRMRDDQRFFRQALARFVKDECESEYNGDVKEGFDIILSTIQDLRLQLYEGVENVKLL
jgi:hypothetical protein